MGLIGQRHMNYFHLILLFARYYDQISVGANKQLRRTNAEFKQFKRSCRFSVECSVQYPYLSDTSGCNSLKPLPKPFCRDVLDRAFFYTAYTESA